MHQNLKNKDEFIFEIKKDSVAPFKNLIPKRIINS